MDNGRVLSNKTVNFRKNFCLKWICVNKTFETFMLHVELETHSSLRSNSFKLHHLKLRINCTNLYKMTIFVYKICFPYKLLELLKDVAGIFNIFREMSMFIFSSCSLHWSSVYVDVSAPLLIGHHTSTAFGFGCRWWRLKKVVGPGNCYTETIHDRQHCVGDDWRICHDYLR